MATFIHNDIFAIILKALFIVHFKLADRTQFGPSSETLCIGASLAMLPYGWTSKNDVFKSTPVRPLPIAVSPSRIDSSGRRRNASVEVFLQITQIFYVSEVLPNSYDKENQTAWAKFNSPEDPHSLKDVRFVGLVLLSDGWKHDQDSMLPLPILKKDIEAFRNGRFFTRYSWAEEALGERVPRPLTPGDLITFVPFLWYFTSLILTGI